MAALPRVMLLPKPEGLSEYEAILDCGGSSRPGKPTETEAITIATTK